MSRRKVYTITDNGGEDGCGPVRIVRAYFSEDLRNGSRDRAAARRRDVRTTHGQGEMTIDYTERWKQAMAKLDGLDMLVLGLGGK